MVADAVGATVATGVDVANAKAGTYTFWIEMKLPDYWIPEESRGCSSRDNSEEHVTLTINPGVPRLVIGPESAPPGTVSNQYSLQMTASVPDAKTGANTL